MPKDYLSIGCTPISEKCVAVTQTKHYRDEMQKEVDKYKLMLERRFPIPDSITCRFAVKWFAHDFGSYAEVVVYYNDENEDECNFAYFVESNVPDTWSNDEILHWIEN